jgi:hypothetical protein
MIPTSYGDLSFLNIDLGRKAQLSYYRKLIAEGHGLFKEEKK